MGLQKGEKGYAFRWLVPIFALIDALGLLILSLLSTIGNIISLASYIPFISGYITIVLIFMWFLAVLMLVTAILAFAMNKKGSYIMGVIAGGLVGLVYLATTVSTTILIGLLGFFTVFPLAAFAICVCVFSAVAISKCDYDRTAQEKNMMGDNLTYVGFENDTAPDYSMYHASDAQGRFDPYAPPPQPEVVEPPKKQYYTPQGPSGKITCTTGMYRGTSFDIVDNEELVIGRDPRLAQIVIGEGAQNVSREHCRILYKASDNSYSIKDMSKNGTYSAATKSRLPHKVYTGVPAGTEIYLGDRSNMFRLG